MHELTLSVVEILRGAHVLRGLSPSFAVDVHAEDVLLFRDLVLN